MQWLRSRGAGAAMWDTGTRVPIRGRGGRAAGGRLSGEHCSLGLVVIDEPADTAAACRLLLSSCSCCAMLRASRAVSDVRHVR